MYETQTQLGVEICGGCVAMQLDVSWFLIEKFRLTLYGQQ